MAYASRGPRNPEHCIGLTGCAPDARLWHRLTLEMLEGHDSDPLFCTGFKAAKALFCTLQQVPIPWGRLRVGGAWQAEVRRWLKGLGWCEIRSGPGVTPFSERNLGILVKPSHKFGLFLQQKRRDATALRGRAVYDERSCRITRELYRKGDANARAVLLGAANSPAVYKVTRPWPTKLCLRSVVW